jgi:hypothetical protein
VVVEVVEVVEVVVVVVGGSSSMIKRLKTQKNVSKLTRPGEGWC